MRDLNCGAGQNLAVSFSRKRESSLCTAYFLMIQCISAFAGMTATSSAQPSQLRPAIDTSLTVRTLPHRIPYLSSCGGKKVGHGQEESRILQEMSGHNARGIIATSDEVRARR